MMNLTKQNIIRFQKFIELDLLTGCWLWKGSKQLSGYGLFSINGKTCTSHRSAYEYWNGEIPNGLQIDHLCRNTSCCNPNHLEAVTPKENTLRGIGPSAINAKKTHCSNGHAFAEENIYSSEGHRICKICQYEYRKKFVQNNPERVKQVALNWYYNNKEKALKNKKERYYKKKRLGVASN